MKWKVVAIGRPSLPWARAGIADYEKRLRRYTDVDLCWIKAAATPAATSRRVLSALDGCRPVLLDEKGETLSTRALAQRVRKRENEGVKRLAVLVGAADGHDAAVRAAVSEAWALGRLTLQHELAHLVWMEQLYRLETLRRGEAYHRD